MARIHVGLQLEHKAAETGADRIDLTGIAGAAHRLLGQLQKGIKKRPHAEVGHRRTKENRGELTGVHQLHVEVGASPLQQLQFLQGLSQELRLHGPRIASLLHREQLFLALAAALGALKQDHVMAAAIDHAAKAVATADRPVHRPAGQAQLLLDLIEQLQGLAPRPVHLVDEGEDRDAPHAAHLKQFAGLGLQALGRVFQHHRVVGGGQGAVGVF